MHLQRHRWLMFVPYALGPQGHLMHGIAHVLFVNSQYLVVRQSGSLSHSGTERVRKNKVIPHILIFWTNWKPIFKILSFFSFIKLISGNISANISSSTWFWKNLKFMRKYIKLQCYWMELKRQALPLEKQAKWYL